jgi:hypothetical protein
MENYPITLPQSEDEIAYYRKSRTNFRPQGESRPAILLYESLTKAWRVMLLASISILTILSRVGYLTRLIIGRLLVWRFVYLAFPWPRYNYSRYNFTTHKLETLSSEPWISCRELAWTALSRAGLWLVLNWLRIHPESRYIVSAPTKQKAQLYCWVALTAQKTSHAAAIVACHIDVFSSALRINKRGEARLHFLLLRALPSNEQ